MNERSTDIIVVGGGIAGYAAAMAASETNRVTLIEKSDSPGGAATRANVGTLCGLYHRSETATPIAHPFCRKFTEELFRQDRSARLVSPGDHLHVISYEWSALQWLLHSHLSSRKIDFHTDSQVVNVRSNSGRIESITLLHHSGKEETFVCRALIDCTGTGYVAQLLDHTMIRSDTYQSAAQVIRLEHVQAQNEYSLTLALKKAVIKTTGIYQWPSSYSSLSVVPGSLRDQQVDIKIPLSGTVTDDGSATEAFQQEVKQPVAALMSVLLEEVESLYEARVGMVFPMPGIRTQQRPLGKYILTHNDVATCCKAEDGIAIGTWPMEEWDYNGKVSMEYFAMNDFYTLPARCLMSPVYENLFFAGKGISAETKAIASARVTGTCLQTGYAAGKLATCPTGTERAQVIQTIQHELRSQG